jgi:hypothetical protein
MGSSTPLADRDAVLAALTHIEQATAALAELSLDGFTPLELLDVLDRRETITRRQPVLDHRIYHRLRTECSPTTLGATSIAKAVAFRLRISVKEAQQRIDDADLLGPRTALTGEPLPPKLPSVAKAQAHGKIGAEHLDTIRWFTTKVPAHVDQQTRAQAEADLARHASDLGPESFRKAAERLMFLLDQDGEFSDIDRAARRSLTLGRQGPDGMSKLSGWLTPEARATWEPILAKLAAPGMCNAADDAPTVDGDPTTDQVRQDLRSHTQRNHDAFLAVGRAVLACGELGKLNGLPASLIVSVTLKELEAAVGHGLTAGGTLLPMADVLRISSFAYHYLVIYDGNGIPLHLGRTQRCASPGQRIVLLNKDRGCTKPGCTANGYQSHVHHAVADWKNGGQTDIDDLTLACKADNLLVENTEWTTRKNIDGITEWIPPPHLDTGQPRTNNYHHPERLLTPPEDEAPGEHDVGTYRDDGDGP